jgi:HSP20 family protein
VERSRPDDRLAPFAQDLRGRMRGDRWQPALDVYETEKALVLRVELGGVTSADVRVTLDGEWLVIRGERRAAGAGDLRRLHQVEVPSGPFERRVRVTVPFEREQVSAGLEDGFLTVVLPKRHPQRIPVRSDEP